LAPLGEGGMGKVYRARDTRLERTVAIKFLHGRAVDDPDRRLRFLREARAEAALYHPNIATVLDVGEAEVDDPDLMPKESGRPTRIVPYLVLEFVAGHDLRSRILDGPLPLAETLRLARQIAAGLEAAHAAGIVHRDLKPANVLITASGLVKILDFGLARFVSPEPPTADSPTDLQTAEGAILGTPPYLAPEQAVGHPLDARADLFALGVMLFQMTTGALPFRGDNPIDLLQSALRDEPFDLAEKAPGTPPRFAALVAKLLKKHPIDRPASAAEVARELDAIAHELGDLPTSVDGNLPARTPTTLFSRTVSRRNLRLTAAATLVALAAAGYPFYERQRAQAEAARLIEAGRAAEGLTDPQAARIAASAFEQATRIRPRDATAWAELSRSLADAYEQDHRPEFLEQAEKAAQRALELAPGSTYARLAQARMERLRGDTDSAIASLESIPRDGPDLEAVERALANAWEQKGDLVRAEAHLLAAVAAAPSSWRSWNALGGFRSVQGNRTAARAAFEKARDCAPKSVTIPQENLAALLLAEGNVDAAITAYEAIQRTASPISISNLGALYYFKGRFAEAEGRFRQAIAITPREPTFHRNLADTLLRIGSVAEARGEYETALLLVDELLRQTPKDVGLRLSRALFLARAERCAEAVEFARKLDRELPANAQKAHGLAAPFALCGATSEALAKMREAIGAGIAPATFRSEDEFASLRGDRAFEQLVGAPASEGSPAP
jgi:tetratricopeptide (TPR) repeat protein/tRNA A-37 threonylcarbamoyl transferase component Bud32